MLTYCQLGPQGHQNTTIFTQENTFENIVCKMSAIWFRPQMCQKRVTWVLRSSPPFNKKHFQDVVRPCVHPMCILNKKRACLVLIFFSSTQDYSVMGRSILWWQNAATWSRVFFRWCKQWSLEFMSAGCTARWLMFSILPIVFFSILSIQVSRPCLDWASA